MPTRTRLKYIAIDSACRHWDKSILSIISTQSFDVEMFRNVLMQTHAYMFIFTSLLRQQRRHRNIAIPNRILQ